MAVKVVFRLGDFFRGEAEAAADLAGGEAGKAVLVKEGADPIESYRANEGTDRGVNDGSRDRQGQETGKGQDQFGRDWGSCVIVSFMTCITSNLFCFLLNL